MKTHIFLIGVILSTFQFATATITQQWYSNPRVIWSSQNKDFKSCMQNQIVLQKNFAPDVKFFWADILPKTTGDVQELTTMYCLLNEDNYCKQSFVAKIETTDPLGWQDDYTGAPDYAVKASDMGRFIEFTDYKTGAPDFIMDLDACKIFFGVK